MQAVIELYNGSPWLHIFKVGARMICDLLISYNSAKINNTEIATIIYQNWLSCFIWSVIFIM